MRDRGKKEEREGKREGGKWKKAKGEEGGVEESRREGKRRGGGT